MRAACWPVPDTGLDAKICPYTFWYNRYDLRCAGVFIFGGCESICGGWWGLGSEGIALSRTLPEWNVAVV